MSGPLKMRTFLEHHLYFTFIMPGLSLPQICLFFNLLFCAPSEGISDQRTIQRIKNRFLIPAQDISSTVHSPRGGSPAANKRVCQLCTASRTAEQHCSVQLGIRSSIHLASGPYHPEEMKYLPTTPTPVNLPGDPWKDFWLADTYHKSSLLSGGMSVTLVSFLWLEPGLRALLRSEA